MVDGILVMTLNGISALRLLVVGSFHFNDDQLIVFTCMMLKN